VVAIPPYWYNIPHIKLYGGMNATMYSSIAISQPAYLSKSKSSSILISILFLIGIAYPTSIGGEIDRNLTFAISLFTVAMFSMIVVIAKKMNLNFLISLLLINTILWTATLINYNGSFERSAATFFFLLTLMYCLKLDDIKASNLIIPAFNTVNIVLIAVGFGIIFHLLPIWNFLVNYYSDFYPELVPNMLDRGKPVVSFGTHSIAGFFMFLFFFLNYKTYTSFNKKIYLVMAFIYLFFCLELQSNTSIFFLVVGVVMLIVKIKKKLRFFVLSSLPIMAIILMFGNWISAYWEVLKFNIMKTTLSTDNGILGRYADGNQSQNVEYLLSHPFSAIGFTGGANSDVVLFDSGIVVTTIRGSVILLILIYATLFFFFRSNLVNKRTSLFLFIVFMIFELGFNNLYYFRTIMTIPFIIIFLNYIENNSVQSPHSSTNEIE
jgi:hypothetical protein